MKIKKIIEFDFAKGLIESTMEEYNVCEDGALEIIMESEFSVLDTEKVTVEITEDTHLQWLPKRLTAHPTAIKDGIHKIFTKFSSASPAGNKIQLIKQELNDIVKVISVPTLYKS